MRKIVLLFLFPLALLAQTDSGPRVFKGNVSVGTTVLDPVTGVSSAHVGFTQTDGRHATCGIDCELQAMTAVGNVFYEYVTCKFR